MDNEFFSAFALVFVIEGMLPFLSPRQWRQTIIRIAAQEDHIVRKMGLISMLAGCLLLYLFR